MNKLTFINKIILPILLVIIYAITMLIFGNLVSNIDIKLLNNSYLNRQFMYQIMLLILVLFSILVIYLLNNENFKLYFSIGNISAKASELTIFGIKEGDSWLKTGLLLSFFITLGTGLFMYFPLIESKAEISNLGFGLIWILLFSLTNSFAEEMLFRIGIISPLSGILQPKYLFLISAILFGLPHLAGMPSGIVGACMAGLLGYILAKSVYETQGIFWAWFIHFLQDIVIFGVLYLINNKNTV